MLVKTSRFGSVREGVADAGKREVAHALLYDFDIDGSRLKERHRQWLLDHIVSAVRNDSGKQWHLYLKGKTSRTGSAGHNLVLSDHRARAAEEFIAGNLGGAGQVEIAYWGVGMTEAHGPRAEDAGDRAVEVVLQDVTPAKPTPRPVEPPRPTPLPDQVCTKNFVISQTAALNISEGLSGDGMVFELREPATGQKAYYVYVGLGIGAGIPFDKIAKIKKLLEVSKKLRTLKAILSGAATIPGPPNPFSLTASCTTTAYDFTGIAGFVSASLSLGTPFSRNMFGFGGLRGWDEGFKFRVIIDPFNTANTFGLPSLSDTRGYMWLVEH